MPIRTLPAAISGTNGATLVAGTSGNTGFDSIVIANAAGTSTVATNFYATGRYGARFASNTTSGTNYATEAIGFTTETIKLEIPYRHEAAPAVSETTIFWAANSGTRNFSLAIAPTSGAIRVRDSATTPTTMTGVLPFGSNDYVILLFANRTTGVIKVQVWLRGASAPITNGSISLTGAGVGAAAFDSFRFGSKASTSAIAYDNTFGDIIIDTDATDIGSPSWMVAPVIDSTPTESYAVFVNLSQTVVAVGPISYTAVPSTGTYGLGNGIFLPASTTAAIDYVITAIDVGTGTTSTLNYTVQPIAGPAQARQRSRIYVGGVLA